MQKSGVARRPAPAKTGIDVERARRPDGVRRDQHQNGRRRADAAPPERAGPAPLLHHSLRPFVVALGLSLGLAVSNGLARFAYALILPSMRQDLEWNYTEAGWLNTANGIGYLVGAILTLWLVKRISPARLYQMGLLLGAAALIATGITRDMEVLSLLRLASGIAAAPTFICGSVLASAIYVHEPDRARTAITIYFGGAGIGLIASGLLLPPLFASFGAKAWPEAWLLLGLISLVLLPVSWWASRSVSMAPDASGATRWPWRRFLPAFAAYACFAAGYVVYVTFVVAWAQEQGANMFAVIALWATLGLATLIAPAFWQPIFTKLSGGQPMAATLAMSALGTIVALVDTSPPALVVSATLFGFGFFMVPSTLAEMSRQALPKPAWGLAMSAYTIVFAAAQMVGPILAGWISDRAGSLHAGLLLGAGILALGALLALWQRVDGVRPMGLTPHS
jgi:MFS family permease